ncbi:uncharacterized protein LOC108039565 isoform X1 [Drosophila rhopaloa]|uniref:tRNA (34-2'-O)-methyltransferase regulator WDR6 n=2 Tax=Drosophila rhopaloa TaxID=1041015 RepID=A0ABM5GZA0_DRORH|nr:uncharacterized protein LOC108039565 isoform X1 [Drosophila rhopaloa]
MVLISDAFAMHVSSNCILVGHGDQAVLYSSNAKVEMPVRLREGKVRGFEWSSLNQSQRLLLLYSENEYSLIICTSICDKDQFQLIYEGETKDWINAAMFFEENATDKTRFVLHTSHSALLYLEFNITSSEDCKVLELARCTDSSILYYTRLHGNCYNKLAIISGNAFGELLLWQTQFPIESECNSIMKTYPLLLRLQAHNGVIHSIDFDLESQLLVTTSDDRSVKFWNIKKSADWTTAELKPMYSCFGHGSRVMCVIIFKVGEQTFVATGGEDSYVCIWSTAGELLLKRRQHFGAPIWRLGFSEDAHTLYSTSSTGNLVGQNLKEIFNRDRNRPTMLSSVGDANEFPRNIKFLNDDTIVGLSSSNRLYYTRILPDSPNDNNWLLVNDFPSYKRTVLEVFDGLIATCGHRRITIHRYNALTNKFENLFDGIRMKGTIRSFQFLSRDQYLVSDNLGYCLLLKTHELCIDSHIALFNDREPWITAALLVSEHYLLLGNRKGHVMLYHRSLGNDFVLKDTIKFLHGKMGANFFKLMNVNKDYANVMSGGHEAFLKYLHIGFTDCTLTVRQRESVPLAWVEAAPSEDLVLGFNDNHIVAWSRQHDVLLQVECGGGNRCWDYRLGSNLLSIAYVKQKRVLFHSSPLYSAVAVSRIKDIQNNTWHTRNCNTIRLLTPKSQADPFILSAGDDNIIKVTKIINDSLFQCAELHSHISTVRCLQAHLCKSENDSSSWLIFSVGGRSQLCISQLNIDISNKCYITELCTHTLQNLTPSKTSTIEARLMAIDIAPHSTEGYFSIYVAGADGKISHYIWNCKNPSHLDFKTFVDIKRCPLTVQWIGNKGLLLITTTNGEIYGFDQTLQTICVQLQLHVTGVNTIDIYVERHILHILSGGDDENIKYTVLNLDSKRVEYKTEFLGLHNAQVNALSIHCRTKETNEESEMFAYTCSIDRQIYRINLKTRQYSRVGYTCIADVKGMLIDECQRMYFYGCGLQTICRQ